MDGYILKRKAIDAVYAGIKLYYNEHHPQKGVYDYILDVVGEIETEDVAQIVHGEWKQCWLKGFETQHIKCSACGFAVPFYERTVLNYCPQCGAKMLGDTVG